MSVTLITQPFVTFNFDSAHPGYTMCPVLSAGNDNIFTVSGNTLGAANVFEYKYIADIYVNGILQVTLKSFPDPTTGIGVFNTRNILTSFIGHDFFPNLPVIAEVLFNQCPNSSCQARLVFGEEYVSGSTFIQNRNLTSGTTGIYINASQSFPDSTNSRNNFSSQLSPFGNQFMTSRQCSPTGTTAVSTTAIIYNSYINQLEQLYFVSRGYAMSSGNTIATYCWVADITVKTFNAAGGVVGKYTISTGFQIDGSRSATLSGNTSGGTDVVSIQIGYNALNSIVSSSPRVVVQSGSLPMMSATVKWYSIYLEGPSQFGVGAIGITLNNSKPIYYFPITDCGRFAQGAYTVSWLNEYGGFNTWLFNKKNETTQNIQRQSYKKVQGKVNADGSYTLNTNSRSEVPYYTVLKDSIVMYTDFITDSDVLYLKTLVSSPVVFITDQNGLCTSVVVKDGSYRINKKVNQKIYSLEMTVEQSYNDYRQLL